MTSAVVQVIPESRESFRAGLQLYRDRPDKGYSPVDCISMQTMRREGLTEVLTNDGHFEQKVSGPCFGIPDFRLSAPPWYGSMPNLPLNSGMSQ